MNKETIQNQAYCRMKKIEEIFCDYVPPHAQQYWLLNFLIAEGIKNYIATHGLQPLDCDECDNCRQSLGLGRLSLFERDCVYYINSHIEDAEKKYQKNKLSIV